MIITQYLKLMYSYYFITQILLEVKKLLEASTTLCDIQIPDVRMYVHV